MTDDFVLYKTVSRERQLKWVKRGTVFLFTNPCNILWHSILVIPLIIWWINIWGSNILIKMKKKCVICLRAKQTQGTFSLSLNKATTIFNFIHFDLRGPYNTPSTFGAFHFLLFWTTIRDLCGFIYLLRKGKSRILWKRFLLRFKPSLTKVLKLYDPTMVQNSFV